MGDLADSTGGDESGIKKGRQQCGGKNEVRNGMRTGKLGSVAEKRGKRNIKAKTEDGSKGAYGVGRLVISIIIKIAIKV